MGSKECSTAYDVQSAVLKHKPGDTIKLCVNRNQKEMQFNITTALRDSKTEMFASKGEVPAIKELGLSLKELEGALVVQSVEEGSEALQKGIKPGMKILNLNRVAVSTIEEFEKIVKEFKGESIMLKLSFQNKEFIEFLCLK